MSCLRCTAAGAATISDNWSFIASRPTPLALRRALSSATSPGGLLGCGLRASGTGASFSLLDLMGSGLSGAFSGLATAGLSVSAASVLGGGAGGAGGATGRSSRSRAIGAGSGCTSPR